MLSSLCILSNKHVSVTLSGHTKQRNVRPTSQRLSNGIKFLQANQLPEMLCWRYCCTEGSGDKGLNYFCLKTIRFVGQIYLEIYSIILYKFYNKITKDSQAFNTTVYILLACTL